MHGHQKFNRAYKAHLKRVNSSGLGLLEVLLALVVVAVFAGAINRSLNLSVKSNSHSGKSQELESIRKTLEENFDCAKSLNVSFPFPILDCSDYSSSIPILRHDGSSLVTVQGGGNKIGKWDIVARCIDDQIIFSVDRNGKNINGVLWSALSSASDLFQGKSEFCQPYFNPNLNSCPAAYPLKMAPKTRGNLCCRRQTNQGPAPDYRSQAMCAAGEYLHSGGGRCWTANGLPSGKAPNYPQHSIIGMTMDSGVIFENDRAAGWLHDCIGAPSNATAPYDPMEMQAFSGAQAICCPQ